MKAKNYISLLSICLCLCQSVSYSQCTNATYGQFPANTYYCVNSDGTPEVIDAFCYAGEFSVVHVEMGFTYEFSSSIPTDYLTVADDQLTPLTYGLSTVSYEATFTGFVAFFTHVNSGCDESEEARSRIISATDPGPCTNDPYGQYPSTTFTPSICDGVTEEIIETDCAAGEYSKVNLIAGNTYHFSSSESQDYITITNESGSSAIIYGYSTNPLEYVATTNQVVRFYLHTDHNCGVNTAFRSRIVKCGLTFCHSEAQWPEEVYSMTACNGLEENITPEAWAGEYTMVNMDMNNTYTLSSSIPTDYITITSANGLVLMTSGTTPLTFVPSITGQYRFILSTNVDCGIQAENRLRNISCSDDLGLDEQNEFELSIYPNPTTNTLTISANESIEAIQVISIDGKILLKETPVSLSTSVSLEHFQSGTYFIQATINGVVQIKEVVKQ